MVQMGYMHTVDLLSTNITGAADNPIAWAAVNRATTKLDTLLIMPLYAYLQERTALG